MLPNVRLLAVATALGLVVTEGNAVALRKEKATDVSVCDLGPNTNEGLGLRSGVLIPARASSADQGSALLRLAGRFVAEQCRNGQLLILHGQSSSQVDVSSLSQLANASCLAAAVDRREVAYNTGFGSESGFELRCLISKHTELSASLAELERTDPFDQLLTRMARQAGILRSQQPAEAASTDAKRNEATKCNEMSLSSLLGKGTCSK